jgi:hypothetical protein
MKFTIENQKGNKITNTTKQTVKLSIYSDNEVSITGILTRIYMTDAMHDVWHKQGKKMTKRGANLTLSEAVLFANNLINSMK